MSGPRIKNIIFDWSGTLFDDFEVSFISTRATIKHFGGKTISKKEYREEFTLPVWKFYRRYIPRTPIDVLNKYYFDHFAEGVRQSMSGGSQAPRGKLFRGTKKVLVRSKKMGIRLFVFSTVRPSILEPICRRERITSFFDGIDGDIRDKQKSLKSFLKKHHCKADETLFVGDTEHDIVSAKKNGLMSGALLCGYQPPHRLLACAPDFVWNDHGGLVKFLNSPSPPLNLRGGRGALQPIPTVGALIFNRGDIFLIQTHKWGHTFGIPGGKIKKGETMIEALKREIGEETRLRVKNIRWAMIQDCIDSKEFYRPKAHFLLINFTADSTSRRFKLNDEAESGFWVNPRTALKLRLNTPTRILLENYLSYR